MNLEWIELKEKDYPLVKEIYDYVYTNVRFFTNNRQTPVIRGNFDENMPMGTIRF